MEKIGRKLIATLKNWSSAKS